MSIERSSDEYVINFICKIGSTKLFPSHLALNIKDCKIICQKGSKLVSQSSLISHNAIFSLTCVDRENNQSKDNLFNEFFNGQGKF